MRPTGMRALGLALAMLVLVGCADDTARGGAAGAAGYAGCAAEDVAGRGRVVASADLEGNGGKEQVRLLGRGDGSCRDSLVAVVDGRVVGANVRHLELVARPATMVSLRGREAPDLVLL